MALVPPECNLHFAKNNAEQSNENELACEHSLAALLSLSLSMCPIYLYQNLTD